MSDDTNTTPIPTPVPAPAAAAAPVYAPPAYGGAAAPAPARRAYLPWWGWTLVAAALVVALLAGVRLGVGIGRRAQFVGFRHGIGTVQVAPGWYGGGQGRGFGVPGSNR